MKTFLVLAILASTILSACTRDNNKDCLRATPNIWVTNPNAVVE